MPGAAPFLPLAGGLLGGLLGGGSQQGPPVTSTVTPDDASTRWLEQYRTFANQNYQSVAGGPNPNLQGAQNAFSTLAGGAGAGMQMGLGGLDQYLSPYLDEVIGSARRDIFDPQRDAASLRANDLATKAGAFGGDRSAILQAEMLRDVNRNEASTLSGLRESGYQNAVNQLLSERARVGGLGLAGAQGLFGLGQYGDQRMQQALQALLAGFPGGGMTTAQNTFTNPFANILGGVTTGFDILDRLKGGGGA